MKRKQISDKNNSELQSISDSGAALIEAVVIFSLLGILMLVAVTGFGQDLGSQLADIALKINGEDISSVIDASGGSHSWGGGSTGHGDGDGETYGGSSSDFGQQQGFGNMGGISAINGGASRPGGGYGQMPDMKDSYTNGGI